MKLHYSQTDSSSIGIVSSFTALWNYTILKLILSLCFGLAVLLPYEITLFSNSPNTFNDLPNVLLPYEITLFSNVQYYGVIREAVLLPYEITLFSN